MMITVDSVVCGKFRCSFKSDSPAFILNYCEHYLNLKSKQKKDIIKKAFNDKEVKTVCIEENDSWIHTIKISRR